MRSAVIYPKLGALLAAVVCLSANFAFAADCEAKAAKATKDCHKACEKMKESPEMASAMKGAQIKDCDAMCDMAKSSAKQSCENKDKKRKK